MIKLSEYILRKTKPFIQVAERYLKIDVVYLAKGSLWLNVNHILTALFSFALAVALANMLPENVFGNYRYILSLAAIVGSFSLTGLDLAVIRDVARGAQGLLRSAARSQLKWSMAALCASLVISAYYFFKGNTEIALSAIVMAIFLPIIASTHLYTAFWEGKKDYRTFSLYNIVTTAVYTTSLFFLVLFTQYLPFIIFGYFATQAACSWYFYRKTLACDKGQSGTSQQTVSFGKHISFLNVFSTLAAQLDKMLVFHYLGAVQLAIYAISQIPVSYVRMVFKQMVQLSYPKFSEKTIREIKSTIYHKMLVVTVPMTIVVAIYIALAPFIFEIFFPKYTEAIFFSQISMLSLLFFQKKLVAYAILATGSKKHIYSMSIWASVFKIVLLLVLLPLYGIWGAIAADLVLQSVSLVTTVLFLKSVARTQKKDGISRDIPSDHVQDD